MGATIFLFAPLPYWWYFHYSIADVDWQAGLTLPIVTFQWIVVPGSLEFQTVNDTIFNARGVGVGSSLAPLETLRTDGVVILLPLGKYSDSPYLLDSNHMVCSGDIIGSRVRTLAARFTAIIEAVYLAMRWQNYGDIFEPPGSGV